MGELDAGTMSDKASPWWVKAGVQFGVPTLLCVGLVYWIVGDADRKHNAMLADSVFIRQEITAMGGTMNAHIDSTGHANAAILYYLQQLCIQGASNAGTPAKDCTYKGP